MWIGADPGGKNRFGVAVLYEDGTFDTWCVSCADDALKYISTASMGLGIDSPLWWSSGLSGDRLADQWLRKTHKIPGGTVQAANSLRGAAIVQGHMLIARARTLYPSLQITEAHPKAIIMALKLDSWQSIANKFALKGQNPPTEHERDAVLAAIAAREGFSGRWKRDLGTDRSASEQNPAELWFGKIHYWWPC
jgi:predicted nuclease with RNAse H fold